MIAQNETVYRAGMELALFQPEIAGNVGTILRLSACMGVRCHIIQPCGFPFSQRALKRSGMDYLDMAAVMEHASWKHFCDWAAGDRRRLVLMTTKGATPLPAARFTGADVLVMGQESAGAPDYVHSCAKERVLIPMQAGTRSLNIAIAAGIALAEGLRQTGQFPMEHTE